MGPCPFRHGYCWCPAVAWLSMWRFNGAMPFQAWIYLTYTTTTPGCFNGAMPFQAWICCRQGRPNSTGYTSFNGAMPFQAWIQQLTRFSLTHQLGFNGAMPFQAWILGCGSRLKRRNRCFNGAMPFQAWIRGGVFAICRLSIGFNGAMPFQAWIRQICCHTAADQASASMGPCPFRHGYSHRRRCSASGKVLQWGHALSGMDTTQPCRPGWRSILLASMGPCPFRHGYLDPLRHLITVTLASMGPCPFRHGYLAISIFTGERNRRLQWGHALSGMDTLSFGSTGGGTMMLQWGHALSGMDTHH